MPELPEAEANRLRFAEAGLNRTVTGFTVRDAAPMELPSVAERKRLEGRQFTQTRRHGKYIFAGSASGPWLVIHLGMSGALRPFEDGDEAPDHARVTIAFEGRRRIAFRCPRKFGWMKLVEDPDAFIAERKLGPDALEIGESAFAERVGAGRGAIKPALIDQKKLAGVGNLWSDEALYRAGIMPETRVDRLSAGRMRTLRGEVRSVLQGVVQTGADYSKLPDDWLIHHRRAGDECPRCGGTIAKKTVGGRTSYHCPDHQEGVE